MPSIKGIPYIKFLPLILFAFVFYKFVNQTDILMQAFDTVLSILAPIFWGVIIAYLLNPVLHFCERQLKMRRGFAIAFIYTVLLLLIIGSTTIVMPRLVNSVVEIVKELPNYAESARNWIQDRTKDFQALEAFVNTYNLTIEGFVKDNLAIQLSALSEQLQAFALNIGKAAFDITSGIFKFIVGLVMSIYMLKDKEAFNRGTKKLLHAYLGATRAHRIIAVGRDVNRVFSRYIVGKTVDSLIIGIIAFVVFSWMNVKFTLLLAIIIGLTNMIPTFGPFIGAVPAIVLTLFYSPIQALWVGLFILLLQQFDGYYLGPKILGDSVGLSPFWIIFAIIVGGGLFGIVGMLICVPLLAVLRNLNNDYMERKFQGYEAQAAALLEDDLLEHD